MRKRQMDRTLVPCRVCGKGYPSEDYVATVGGVVCHNCTERMADALDVQKRRGWSATKIGGKWGVIEEIKALCEARGIQFECQWADNPLTAMLAANEWYKQNVDKPQGGHDAPK